jgi:2-iminobutanoate/2-iminopropanoate deaminase
MEKKCLTAPNGVPALGPYSHAVSAGGMLYVSGQGPLTKEGNYVPGDLAAEAHLTLQNLKTVLEDCGSSLGQVVKATVYLADMGQFAAFNAIYQEYFNENPPARTCIQAGRLPKDFKVEVDAIAVLSQE